MTWSALNPTRQTQKSAAPISVTIGRASVPSRRMSITLRPHLFPELPRWCMHEASVSIEAGSGEHAGCLRLRAIGPWRFMRAVGSSESLSLRLPVPKDSPAEGCAQVPVAYRIANDVVEITLPTWSPPPPAMAVPKPSLAASKPPPAPALAPLQQPHVGICSRVPDPNVALQPLRGSAVR